MRKKSASAYRIATAVFVLLAVIFTAAYWYVSGVSRGASSEGLTPLSGGWYYRTADGGAVSVTLPCKIEAGTELELVYQGGQALRAGYTLATKAAVYDVQMYVGNTLIAQYRDDGRKVNDAVRGNILCFGAIPTDSAGETLRVVYHSESGEYNLPAVTQSTEQALMTNALQGSVFVLFVATAMVVIGLLSVVLSMMLRSQEQDSRRVIDIAAFLLLCGLWGLSDAPFVMLLANYSAAAFAADFYLFMFLPIPLYYFVLHTADMKKYALLRALPFLYYVNIIGQSVLSAFRLFTFFEMLYVSHVLMIVVGLLAPLSLLIYEYRSSKNRDVRVCIRVLATIGVIGAVAIILYEFSGYATYQKMFQTGLLVLMAVLLASMLQELLHAFKYRTEAQVYKKLSEQDKLTKLDNRRAFDALIEKMEQGAVNYSDAALLFMDLNFLKRTNDTMGHAWGDRLLIRAADCVKAAYGKFGYCYRLGGDEFCAVIINPSYNETELLARIQTEVDKANEQQEGAIALSIACGCSFIGRGKARKSISQWKTEADVKMYANKERSKRLQVAEQFGQPTEDGR